MFLANNGLFESPYVVIGKDCKELPYPILWADEQMKKLCVYKMKNNCIVRNKFGFPETKILRDVEFKIISREDFSEIGIRENKKLELVKI